MDMSEMQYIKTAVCENDFLLVQLECVSLEKVASNDFLFNICVGITHFLSEFEPNRVSYKKR